MFEKFFTIKTLEWTSGLRTINVLTRARLDETKFSLWWVYRHQFFYLSRIYFKGYT